MRQNPHVRICGGPGSATTLVYPTVVTVPIQLLIAPTQDQMANLFATNADVPPEVLELVEAFSRSGVAVAFFGFMVMLGLGMVFSSLGGVIGAAIFRRDRVDEPAEAPPPSSA